MNKETSNMEEPKEIYVYRDPFGFLYATEFENHPKEVVKYIRSDLAELTWEDMKKITFVLGQVCGLDKEFDGEQSVYEEVLRRFNEQRGK